MNLNITPDFTELIPLTYSMLINNIDYTKQKNVKSEYNFLNLETLVYQFQLDKSFISKSYYQSNPEFSYNEPPKGPIERNFECVYCNQSGPDNHLKTCKRPFTSSLYLTKEFNNFDEGMPYNMVIAKRGQKKVVSTSVKSDKFQDSVEIIYSDVNERETTIRIAKNGSINIISSGFGNKKLPELIVNKVNETSALNLREYRKVYPNKNKFDIDPKITYKYLMFAQFNMYPKKYHDQYFINLSTLSNSLKEYIDKNNVISSNGDSYVVSKFQVNTGNVLSKNNKTTNPLINFNLVPNNPDTSFIKFSVVIYKRGAVQIRLSYNKKSEQPLELKMLEKLYSFLEEILSKIILSKKIIQSEEPVVKKGITNMVDSRQPQMCHDREGLRPVPYSFHGVCPDPSMYIRPEGKRRVDGRYEPCCYKLKENGKDSLKRYKNILKNGYPDADAEKYDENIPDPDDKSAVFSPGTKILESRRFKGLMDMEREELFQCMKNTGYIKKEDIFDCGEYKSLKIQVLNEYRILTGTKKLINQHPITLTNNSIKLFTKEVYILTPINNDFIKVFLFFNASGESYFINENSDISLSTLPNIGNMENTLIEGYLYPYEDELLFHPIDILYLNNKELGSLPFYSRSNKDNRFSSLMYSIEVMNSYSSDLVIESSNFDLNIISGAKHFLSNTEYNSILFIPINVGYSFGKINKKLLIWNDSNNETNSMICLNVYSITGTKWRVEIDSNSIPEYLLPGEIEIPVQFVKKNNLVDGDFVLFKINKLVNGLINVKKPLIPISKETEKIHDYYYVINILESINSPIPKTAFRSTEIVINNTRYSHYMSPNGNVDLNTPLNIT